MRPDKVKETRPWKDRGARDSEPSSFDDTISASRIVPSVSVVLSASMASSAAATAGRGGSNCICISRTYITNGRPVSLKVYCVVDEIVRSSRAAGPAASDCSHQCRPRASSAFATPGSDVSPGEKWRCRHGKKTSEDRSVPTGDVLAPHNTHDDVHIPKRPPAPQSRAPTPVAAAAARYRGAGQRMAPGKHENSSGGRRAAAATRARAARRRN
jgi:hypothetical protein